jgi:hypothetical protein
MSTSYAWPKVAYRRALIDAAGSVLFVAFFGWLWVRGRSAYDLSWVVLLAPLCLYHAYHVVRLAMKLRQGDEFAGRAMTMLTGLKIVGWVTLAVYLSTRQWWLLVAVAAVMLALKVGELGIYVRYGREQKVARMLERRRES